MYNLNFLNSIFEFNQLPITIESIMIESGQRTVYKGLNKKGDNVVVKIFSFNELKISRIQREIKILSCLNNKYFPKFYCQEFISKENIDNYIDNLKQEEANEILHNKPRPFFLTCEEFIESIGWEEFQKYLTNELALLDFTSHLFTALSILWDNKIVHRDIKPDNILIRNDLSPVIIDLGIAKSLREGTQNFTAFGLGPFTPQYAAPEQFVVESEINYKADQFAVGVILYHLVTGNFPYGRHDEIEAEGLLQNFKSNFKPISPCEINTKISREFSEFINRLIAIQPYRRFRNITLILEELNKIRSNLIC